MSYFPIALIKHFAERLAILRNRDFAPRHYRP